MPPPPPFAGKVSKLFRRNSNKRTQQVQQRPPSPVYVPPPLSPVSEGSLYSPIDEPARPVPPPQHYHHDAYPEYDLPEAEPHSRLYETFSHTASEAATPLPLAVQQELEDEHEDDYHHHHHIPQHHEHAYPEEMGYAGTLRSDQVPQDRSILIAPSTARSSDSGGSRGQKVTFKSDPRGHTGSAPVLGKGISTTRSFSSANRLRPPTHNYSGYARSGSVRSERPYRAPRSENHDGYYQQRLPYMIFSDYGNGLEIGNEVDGFMPYEEYLATAHMRNGPSSTYFIIPGSTPVIFHDEHGQEMYRVDAQKYNTPTLRRRRYIIQDEHGNEMFKIGNWSRQEKYGSANGSDRSFGSGSHSSKAPRVMYLNSHHGSPSSRSSPRRNYYSSQRDRGMPAHNYSDSSSSRGTQSDEARTVYTESSAPDILVVDENGGPVYDSRNNASRDFLASPRSQYAARLQEREPNNYTQPSYTQPSYTDQPSYTNQPSYTSSDMYTDKYTPTAGGGSSYHPSNYTDGVAIDERYDADEHYDDEDYPDMHAHTQPDEHYSNTHQQARSDDSYY